MSKYPNVECGECPVWLGGTSKSEMLKCCRERHCDLLEENEQIQEMARVISTPCDERRKDGVNCHIYSCEICMANNLYAKGYRKVERGEWIEKTHDWDFGDYIDYTCSICGIREQNKRKFCPECGADMRGEQNV